MAGRSLISAVAAAGAPDDGGRADDGDGGPGGGDRGLLAREPAADHGVPALALREQGVQRLLVADEGFQPAARSAAQSTTQG